MYTGDDIWWCSCHTVGLIGLLSCCAAPTESKSVFSGVDLVLRLLWILTTNSRTLRLQMATAAMLLFYFCCRWTCQIYPHQIAAACYNFSLILSHFGGSLVGAPGISSEAITESWNDDGKPISIYQKKRLFRNLPDEVPWLWFISACLCWHK